MIEERYLFHISPSENEEAIGKQGFIPKNGKVFFARGSVQERMGMFLFKWMARRYERLGRGKEYTIYKLDVGSIPETVEFFPDPENKPMFVYAEQVIPYSSVVTKTKFKIDEWFNRSRSNS